MIPLASLGGSGSAPATAPHDSAITDVSSVCSNTTSNYIIDIHHVSILDFLKSYILSLTAVTIFLLPISLAAASSELALEGVTDFLLQCIGVLPPGSGSAMQTRDS